MREFAVDRAYVVDPSLAQDTIVDWAKIDAADTLDGATAAEDFAGATETAISRDPLALTSPCRRRYSFRPRASSERSARRQQR
jgi:hypothetical protein